MLTTQPQVFYCGQCLRYLAPTGRRVEYARDAEVIIWVECSSCLARRLEREAEEEERRRREEKRRAPRQCDLADCNELFVPGTDWQRFCCDEHRWAAHRLSKTARLAR